MDGNLRALWFLSVIKLTSGKTSVALEPNGDADNSGEVNEAETESGAYTDGAYERRHILCKWW